jgi:N-acetylmuramoyl-L-alanine amidase
MKKFSKVTDFSEGRFRAGRSTKLLVIHCAATPEGRDVKVESVDRWHRNLGWSGIGYHFFVELDGSIKVGRPLYRIGSHVRGKNRYSIGICYAGGVDRNLKPKDTRTPEQKMALIMLTKAIVRDNWDIVRIAGHNEFSSKACPSFDVRTDELGNIHGFTKGRKNSK